MELINKERRRAFNIIWNASEDYSFSPVFEDFDADGKADLYWNYIIGAVHRLYDYSMLSDFFSSLQKDPNHKFFESLAWIGLENCAYLKGVKERPILEILRRQFSEKVISRQIPPSYYYLIDEIRLAHFHKVLGDEIQTRDQVSNLLASLEFKETASTEEIIIALNEILLKNFALSEPKRKRDLLSLIFSSKNNLPFANPFSRLQRSLFSPHSRTYELGEKKEGIRKQRSQSKWMTFAGYVDRKKRGIISNFFGISILTEAQIEDLESAICIENHKGCHLHLTRGDFNIGAIEKGKTNKKMSKAFLQREKNRDFYNSYNARNYMNITRLTNIIRNTLILDKESCFRSETGALVAGKVWRNLYLNDSKVFLRNRLDEIGNTSVDLILDASGSQMERQELIASEAYIIAESLNRCQIPVRVCSFCTSGSFTVINIFRDYLECDNNHRIFNFYSTGCNRDGLAIRTVLHLMQEYRYEHKILIVLSDAKPVDPAGFAAKNRKPETYFYGDEMGIIDTATEVRKGRQNGVSIMCVYTGIDEDIPAAKRIFGHHFVRIDSPDKFAHMVGILLQNELRSF